MIPIRVFFDNMTKFNGWSGPETITGVIVSLVNIIVTIVCNKKKVDADLKAKARIEWIQSVKEITANSIASIMDLIEMERTILRYEREEILEHAN
ncbi:hypothetical protein [Enterococcus sp. AZ126]|uniref:hypothetical protein n=1 Tax=Enterococcus sp. AZ126 TaxID=2774635 RepID=UPI003F226F59